MDKNDLKSGINCHKKTKSVKKKDKGRVKSATDNKGKTQCSTKEIGNCKNKKSSPNKVKKAKDQSEEDDTNHSVDTVENEEPLIIEDLIDGFAICSFVCLEDLEDFVNGKPRSSTVRVSSRSRSVSSSTTSQASTSAAASCIQNCNLASPEPCSSGTDVRNSVNCSPTTTPPSATLLSDLPGTPGRTEQSQTNQQLHNSAIISGDNCKLLTPNNYYNSKKVAKNEENYQNNACVSFSGTGNNSSSSKGKKDVKGKKKGKVKHVEDKKEKMDVDNVVKNEEREKEIEKEDNCIAMDSCSSDCSNRSPNVKLEENGTSKKGDTSAMEISFSGDGDNSDTDIEEEKMDVSSHTPTPCDNPFISHNSNNRSRSNTPTITTLTAPENQTDCSPVGDQKNSNLAKLPQNLPDVVLPFDPKLPKLPSSITVEHNNSDNINSSYNGDLLHKHSVHKNNNNPELENLKPDLISVTTSVVFNNASGLINTISNTDRDKQFNNSLLSGNDVLKSSSVKLEKDAPFSPKNHHAFLENNKIAVGSCRELSNKINHSGPLSPLNKNLENQQVQQHPYGSQQTVIKHEIKKEDMPPPPADHLMRPPNHPGHHHHNKQHRHHHPHSGSHTVSEKHHSNYEKLSDYHGGKHRAADASAPVKNLPPQSQHNNNSGKSGTRSPQHPLVSNSNKPGLVNPNPQHSSSSLSSLHPYHHHPHQNTPGYSHHRNTATAILNTTASVTTGTTTTTTTASLSSSLHSAASLLSPKCVVSTVSSALHHSSHQHQPSHRNSNPLLSSNSLSQNHHHQLPHHYQPRVTREQPKPIPGLSGTRPDHFTSSDYRSGLSSSNSSSLASSSSHHRSGNIYSRDSHGRRDSSPFYSLRPSPTSASSHTSNSSVLSSLASSSTYSTTHQSAALPANYPLPSHHHHHHHQQPAPHISPTTPVSSLTSSLTLPSPLSLNLSLSQSHSISPLIPPALSLPLGLHRETVGPLGSLHQPTVTALPGGSHAFNNTAAAGMFLSPLPPTSSALSLPSIVSPYGETLPNADLLSHAQRDLNNRFLQDRLGAAGLPGLSPFIRAEMHNHQHQHLHQHNHTHLPGGGQSNGSPFPPPPSPLLTPSVSHLKTPPTHHNHHHQHPSPHHHHPHHNNSFQPSHHHPHPQHPHHRAMRPLHPSTTALMAAEMDSAVNKSPQSASSSQYDKLAPKLDNPYSPFRSPSAVPGLPGYTGLGPLPQLPGLPPAVGAAPTGLGSGLQGAFQPKNLASTPQSMHHAQLLMSFRDREKSAASVAGVSPSSQQPAGSSTPGVKKSGKWCAAHVRIAWEIHMHQQKQKADSARGLEHKPAGLDPLGGGHPPHPSHLLPTSLASGVSLQGLHRPELAPSFLAANPHNRSPYESTPPGHSAASLLNPAHLALSPFARHPSYQLPGLGGAAAAAAAAFGGLGGLTPNGLYPPSGREGLPGAGGGPLAGLGNPQEWNRLHRTPPSFPQPPSTFSKSEVAEKEHLQQQRHQREGSRDREREAIERDRDLREKEREREYGLSRHSPMRLDSREHSSGRTSLDIERLREKERSESNSRESFTERSRSRSPLRNGQENSKLDSSMSSRNGTPSLLNSSAGNKIKDERKDDVVILDDRDHHHPHPHQHREKQNGYRHDLLLGAAKSDLRGSIESYLPPTSLHGLERSRFLPPYGPGSTPGYGQLWNHFDIERQRLDMHREFERQKEHMLSRISSLDRERLAEYERHKSISSMGGALPPPAGSLRLPGDIHHPAFGHGNNSTSGGHHHNQHHSNSQRGAASPLINHHSTTSHPSSSSVTSSSSIASSNNNKSGVVIAPPQSSSSLSTTALSGGGGSSVIPPPPSLIHTTNSNTTSVSSSTIASSHRSHSNSPVTITKSSKPSSPVVNSIVDVSNKERPAVNGIDVESN